MSEQQQGDGPSKLRERLGFSESATRSLGQFRAGDEPSDDRPASEAQLARAIELLEQRVATLQTGMDELLRRLDTAEAAGRRRVVVKPSGSASHRAP